MLGVSLNVNKERNIAQCFMPFHASQMFKDFLDEFAFQACLAKNQNSLGGV